MTLNFMFLAFLIISRFISACPSHRHLSLSLPKTKSLLPPNLLFLLYLLFQSMTVISTQSLKPKFSSSSLILCKDLVTKSVGSHMFSKSTSPTFSSPLSAWKFVLNFQVSAQILPSYEIFPNPKLLPPQTEISTLCVFYSSLDMPVF